ncbi:MAG TPA: UDP-N-acetylmuramoyl-L-alanyl-D-glutamate--2,6-diaminopimelate ligase [Actinomycetota bacterium]|jgi:UDP-N-acetylmuramoyl-L-alanyl-D-glutamate--2,6-diaminopimelate ligase|nr:UDP-N-acetylmuramoyl-L-alanyl-D-glutamate--2,6-diaminopimelate ligase [Actinomycetota bacterium]
MTLTPRRVPLKALAAPVGGGIRGDGETAVSDVVLDTRRVTDGALFCCVPGSRVDGHDLAGAALEAGATALCVERPLKLDAPQLLVGSVRAALAPLADAFFDRPSRRMDLIGVTGTNGKTTTAFMLEAVFRAAGLVPGLIGTVEVRVGEARLPVVHTTPEAPDLQRLFAEMADTGVQAAAMEVSSHGLALGRVDATRFLAAIFTNLTQDHLDFHRDLEDYFQAKRRLFVPAFTAVGVVNIDDPYGRRLAREAAQIELVTTGTSAEADWRASEVEGALDGSTFLLQGPAGSRRVRLRLGGHFNVANALGALAAASALDIELDTAIAGVESLAGVPGRFERVDAGQAFTVLVDYAHTPDSLENVLRAARAVTHGRVLAVFGCGGDRDRAKRPLMGEIAAKLADFTVVTSDNPRSEPPAAIVAQVVEGVRRSAGPERYQAEVDRRAAIRAALELACPGDAVIIAGKGHEQGQEFAGGHRIPFDDRVVAAEELRALVARRWPGGGGRG